MSATLIKATAKAVRTAINLLNDPQVMHDSWEKIVMSAESLDHHFGPEELTIGRMCGIAVDDPYELRSELGRGLRAREALQLAGSPATLAKAQAELTAAETAQAEQGPALADTIAKAESTLRELESSRRAAESKVHTMTTARVALRDKAVLPRSVWRRYDRSRAFAKLGVSSKVETLETRIASIDAIVALELHSREMHNHIHAMKRRDLFNIDNHGNVSYHINPAAWKAYCAELATERHAAAKEAGPLREQLDADLAEAEKQRDFYLAQL